MGKQQAQRSSEVGRFDLSLVKWGEIRCGRCLQHCKSGSGEGCRVIAEGYCMRVRRRGKRGSLFSRLFFPSCCDNYVCKTKLTLSSVKSKTQPWEGRSKLPPSRRTPASPWPQQQLCAPSKVLHPNLCIQHLPRILPTPVVASLVEMHSF